MAQSEWNSQELLECPSFGELWLISRKCGRKSLLKRLRRNKKGLYTAEQKWMEIREELKVGEMVFVDDQGYICRLQATGKLEKAISDITG